jgi:hypothetical protein
MRRFNEIIVLTFEKKVVVAPRSTIMDLLLQALVHMTQKQLGRDQMVAIV